VRRRSVGAELVSGGTEFRVWAREHQHVAVVIDGRDYPLNAEDDGYFCGVVENAAAGTLYRFRLDDEHDTFPDPASRFQPQGPHGASQVIDPSHFEWQCDEWSAPTRKGRIVYEMHVGTFTREGTYTAAEQHLDSIADLGINVIELMPLNEFPGTFGWGYDGVDLWAPSHLYGTPDDLRHFIDTAHQKGLAVILDVVYNHLGPDGCYLARFTHDYFTSRYENEWGEAINFDGAHSLAVREFFCENAAYWIDEFRFDGLRIDATQSIHDAGPEHIIKALTEKAHEAAAGRTLWFVAENEPQHTKLLTQYGVDALWNDDWHHSAIAATTGFREAYYTDYLGRAQEFITMARMGFLYQGQRYEWQKQRRGTPSYGIPPERFVCYLQNHDQTANSAKGERLHSLTSPGRLRAMTALLLLQPQTPMLFQGQEFGSSSPFLYFADHTPELASKVADGRREFLTQFPSIARIAQLDVPHDRETFDKCKLDWRERDRHGQVVALHRDLIRLRTSAPFSEQRSDWLEGSVINDQCLVLRWFTGGLLDRVLIINLGPAVDLVPVSEPLLAPPLECEWQTLWSSEDAAYGGNRTGKLEVSGKWLIPGEAAFVLSAQSSLDAPVEGV
jgi:maltooligosyltrehalose trehalohydrolase